MRLPAALVRRTFLMAMDGKPSMFLGCQFVHGDAGSGAGKGGGTGGSVRDAGGAFGKLEAAREEEYFRKLQQLQLKQLRDQLDDEVEFHERHMKHHQEAIERHKKRMAELKREEESVNKLK